jgi:hypothetical protein
MSLIGLSSVKLTLGSLTQAQEFLRNRRNTYPHLISPVYGSPNPSQKLCHLGLVWLNKTETDLTYVIQAVVE